MTGASQAQNESMRSKPIVLGQYKTDLPLFYRIQIYVTISELESSVGCGKIYPTAFQIPHGSRHPLSSFTDIQEKDRNHTDVQ